MKELLFFNEDGKEKNAQYEVEYLSFLENKLALLDNMNWDYLRYNVKKFFNNNKQDFLKKGLTDIDIVFNMDVVDNEVLRYSNFYWDDDVNKLDNQDYDTFIFNREMVEDDINTKLGNLMLQIASLVPVSINNNNSRVKDLHKISIDLKNNIENTIDVYFNKYLDKEYVSKKQDSLIDNSISNHTPSSRKAKPL